LLRKRTHTILVAAIGYEAFNGFAHRLIPPDLSLTVSVILTRLERRQQRIATKGTDSKQASDLAWRSQRDSTPNIAVWVRPGYPLVRKSSYFGGLTHLTRE
jgi:hypothetical protein